MDFLLNIPGSIFTKRQAKDLITEAFEAGELAISPDGFPAALWREAGRQVARDLKIVVQHRPAKVHGHNVAILRGNKGFPPNIPWESEAAQAFKNMHPEHRCEQRMWTLLGH